MQAVPPEELERLEALASCRIIGTAPEPEYDALVRLAAVLTGSSRAAFILVDAQQLWVKAAHGCTAGSHPRSAAPLELSRLSAGLLESTLEPSAGSHSLSAHARSCAAVPLRDRARTLGMLAVFDPAPRTLSEAQREHLTCLGHQASALLELRRLRGGRAGASAALLRSATRISGIGCWQWDLKSGEITLSDEMFALFGVDTSFPLSGTNYVQFIHPDDRETIVACIELATRGEPVIFPEYRVVRPNGQIRIVHATSELERDAEGVPARLTGALHDVTAQRAAEEQRQQVALKAVHNQKVESLALLSGGVAHEFNNLLVGVRGNAELALADRTLAPTSRDLLERIVEASERASALTRQLLAYTGRSRLKLVDVDLAAQLDRQLARLCDALPRDVTLRSSLPGALPAVRADLEHLQLVASNLVMNAAESYAAGGEVSLRAYAVSHVEEQHHGVSLPTRLGPGHYVVLEVLDHGCGMDRATLERAVDPFFSTKFTGRGLGLSAALGIAASHGAVLTLDSSPGAGSRVRLHFPAQSGPPSSRAPSEPPQLHVGELSGFTVLLVDDEELVRNVERLAMQRAGLSVLEATDGEQAIDVLRQNRQTVDLVVLDLVMPGLDAASTLLRMRELCPDIPVIVQSGYSEEDAAQSLERVDGRLDFLEKPFSVRALLGKVTSVLRRE